MATLSVPQPTAGRHDLRSLLNRIRYVVPEGKALGTIEGAEHPHNFAWGDADVRTLYMTARTGLYRIKLSVEGSRTRWGG